MSFEQDFEREPETISAEEFLQMQRASIRRKSFWAIGIGAALVLLSTAAIYLVLFVFPEEMTGVDVSKLNFWDMLFQNMLFLGGVLAIAGGLIGLRRAKRIKIEDYVPSAEAVAFLDEVRQSKPTYSYLFVGAIVIVYIVQVVTDADMKNADSLPRSIELAGLVKPLVWQGQWWRLATSGALHGGLLHIYFNSQAFFGFGSMMEVLSNRAHLAIVFVLAVFGGSALSLLMLPGGTSVGASGGIMGLVGFLAVYGYRRKKHLPPDFLKNMLINVAFIAAFGLIAWNIVDNYGHLGGFLIGAVYGLVQIPRDLSKDPRTIGPVTDALGMLSVGAFLTMCVLIVLLLAGKIVFVS